MANKAIINTSTLNGIASAIVAKDGGAATMKPSQMAARIAAIQSGWEIPQGWPNLKAIYDADNGHGYTHKVYLLYKADMFPTVQLKGPYHFITSDGSTYDSQTTHTWSAATVESGYGWVAIYHNDSSWRPYDQSESYSGTSKRLLWLISSAPVAITANTDIFNYAYSLRRFDCPSIIFGSPSNISRTFFSCLNINFCNGMTIDTSSATSFSSTLTQCYAIIRIPSLNLSNVTNCSSAFQSCSGLLEVPDVLDVSHCTNVSLMFYQCYCLKRLPSTLDFSSVASAGNQNQPFSGMWSLTTLPTSMTSNWSVSFANSNGITKESLLAFVNGLNTCPNNGQTMTFHSNVKAKFTSEEQASVAASFTAKNWTLAW